MPTLSLHTVLPSISVYADLGAFIGSLVVGIALHYKKIVKNEYYGYPQEWFPSVSATIGTALATSFCMGVNRKGIGIPSGTCSRYLSPFVPDRDSR